MKIEVELKGFTPVLDNLTQEYGLVTAAVYGTVWRYAQMEDKVCKASLEKIGKRLDLSGKTAERHIKLLCNDGYLIDLTPNLRNKPHTYAVTGKAELTGNITAHTDRESYQGQTESLTRSDRESYQGQTESPLKIHSKDTEKDITPTPQKSKNDLNNLADKIAKVAPTDIDTVGPATRQQLKNLTVALSKKPNADQFLTDYEKWWYANDWRGKKGQSPTVWTMGDTWGQFEAAKVGPAANGSGPILTAAQKARLAELSAK
jgi:hypothetical protein